MANGDVENGDVQAFIELGAELSATKATEVDTICGLINADVNLILANLGIALPVTDDNSVSWLKLTKLFGSTSLTLELLAGQDTEEENTRAQRYWDRYRQNIDQLLNSGGQMLEADFQTDPAPNTLPTVVGEYDASQRKRFLRFPQRAAADHHDNLRAIEKTRAGWRSAIEGL